MSGGKFEGPSKEDLAAIDERIAKIREINAREDISWKERVRLHNEIVPGIGDLECHNYKGEKQRKIRKRINREK